MTVSNRTLMKIAAYTGIFAATGGLLMTFKTIDRVRDAEFYREALKLLRSHKGAVEILGEPIKDGRFDLSNRTINNCDSYQAQFAVPVKGPKQKGTYYFWAERRNEEEKWNVYRAELGLESDQSRRLAIKRAAD